MLLGKRNEPKKGLVWLKGSSQRWIRKLCKNPFASNRKNLRCELHLSKKLAILLKA
jgi:hypothetical protein